MNLWTKDPSLITFADVDSFLQTKQPEGMRLDYKVDKPKDLEKLIAAFANTFGGMIILGVESDKATNEPYWPPTKGMPTRPGIDEAMTAIARDAIYPPVRIETSGILENARLTGHSVCVIRVDESREAPHAVDGGRKVYVRTGSTTPAYELAQIDRIKYLFDRRSTWEQERDRMVEEATERNRKGCGQLAFSDSLLPLCWASVIPAYPWRPLCKASTCYEVLRHIVEESSLDRRFGDVQRIPDGAVARFHRRLHFSSNSHELFAVTLVNRYGLVLSVSTALTMRFRGADVLREEYEQSEQLFMMQNLWDNLARRFSHARTFYKRDDVELPGLLHVRIGIAPVQGVRLFYNNGPRGSGFPDPQYADTAFMTASEFLEGKSSLDGFRDRMIYGFDLDTPEGL